MLTITPLIQKLTLHCFRIVRNKAAEKAKLGGYNCSASPPPLHHDSQANMGRHPTYSINGILGIHQADANDNLMKRKRDDEGK